MLDKEKIGRTVGGRRDAKDGLRVEEYYCR